MAGDSFFHAQCVRQRIRAALGADAAKLLGAAFGPSAAIDEARLLGGLAALGIDLTSADVSALCDQHWKADIDGGPDQMGGLDTAELIADILAEVPTPPRQEPPLSTLVNPVVPMLPLSAAMSDLEEMEGVEETLAWFRSQPPPAPFATLPPTPDRFTLSTPRTPCTASASPRPGSATATLALATAARALASVAALPPSAA